MDLPLPQTLRVGKVSVGLIGLDRALLRLTNTPGLELETAVSQVYTEVAAQNYIPTTAVAAYRTAIAKEIRQLRGGELIPAGELIIRILGPGCVSCNNLQKMVIESMAELGLAADVLQIHDLDEIGRFGVMRTPALLINGVLKSAGRLPNRAQIEEWLREA
ncbi:MAG: thioredoxin family protein [Desulfobulbaceae bacterium]|nr:thioredoxin family protein [Desulfobulbaceae bacterium]